MTTVFSEPRACAEAVVARVGRDIKLAIPIGIGKPNLLVNALYDLAKGDPQLRLRIFTGLSLVRPAFRSDIERRFVEPLLARLFPTWVPLTYAEDMRKGCLAPNVEVTEFFLQAGAWLGNATAQQGYASLNYAHVAGHLARIGTNVMAQLVAPEPTGDTSRVSLASNTDVTLDLAPYVQTRRAGGQPIVAVGEINANMPYMTGEAEAPVSEFDMLLRPAGASYDLFAPPKEPVPLADYAMALHAATLVKDGGTLQIGIGSFADALAHALVLRHTRNAEFRRLVESLGTPLHADAELGPFAQGLYGCSEMLVDGFLALRRAGILKRKVKAATLPPTDGAPADTREAIVHAGFFIGSRAFYSELASLSRRELDEIAMTAISFTNTMRGDAAAKAMQRRDARFINTAMTATLLGALSSDALEDGRVVSGVGGQGDFVAMAHELPGARSVIAVRSWRHAARGRRLSNILWRYANTSIPRQLRDIVVTEYGIADLRGRSDGEVAAAMLAVADSEFQARLRDEAEAAKKLPRGAQLPPWAHANTPARLEAALGPARREGLLPHFPLGTDMTETEQTLIPPLGRLKAATPAGAAGLLWKGLGAPRTEAERAAIERMDLRAPRSLREQAMRALILGAMRA